MTHILKVVLICAVIGAAIGVAWASVLTNLQPDWKSRFANPKKWYSWILGPVLCAVLSVGHFVQGRPMLSGTFVILGAVAFFLLLTSAVRTSTLEQD